MYSCLWGKYSIYSISILFSLLVFYKYSIFPLVMRRCNIRELNAFPCFWYKYFMYIYKVFHLYIFFVWKYFIYIYFSSCDATVWYFLSCYAEGILFPFSLQQSYIFHFCMQDGPLLPFWLCSCYFLLCSGCVLVMFRLCSGYVLVMFWLCPGYVTLTFCLLLCDGATFPSLSCDKSDIPLLRTQEFWPHQKLLGDGLSTPKHPLVWFVPLALNKLLFWISTGTAPGPISQVLPGCRVRHPQYCKKLCVQFTLLWYDYNLWSVVMWL